MVSGKEMHGKSAISLKMVRDTLLKLSLRKMLSLYMMPLLSNYLAQRKVPYWWWKAIPGAPVVSEMAVAVPLDGQQDAACDGLCVGRDFKQNVEHSASKSTV